LTLDLDCSKSKVKKMHRKRERENVWKKDKQKVMTKEK